MTSKTIITGFVILAFVAGSIVTGSIAYAKDDPNGTPFQALWDAIDNLQIQIDAISDVGDISELESRVKTLEQVISVINEEPLVDAGEDQEIMVFFESVTLQGTSSDPDGILHPIETQWSLTSGPESLIIDDPDSLTTLVTFYETGNYVLRLTSTDGVATVFDEMTLSVIPTVNIAPDVALSHNAFGDGFHVYGDGRVLQTLSPEAAYTVTAIGTDDEIFSPLTYSWSADSDSVHFSDSTSATTIVSFDETGVFELTVTVFDGELSDTDSVIFTVLEDRQPVIVNAIDDMTIHGDSALIQDKVRLYCNESISAIATGGLGELTYSWIAPVKQYFTTTVTINPTTGTQVTVQTSYAHEYNNQHWVDILVTASDGFYSDDEKFRFNCSKLIQ